MRKKQRNLSNPCLILGPRLALPQATGIPHLAITRRHLLQGGAVAAMAPALGLNPGISAMKPAQAQAAPDGLTWRHAVSTFGDIKYPADFKRFDYVNPDAPKGGVVRLFELGTFDNFNIVIAGREGIARPRRRPDLSSADDPVAGRAVTAYGTAGGSRRLSRRFLLRHLSIASGGALARRQAGDPGRRRSSRSMRSRRTARCTTLYYRHIVKCEKAGERDVKFTFDRPGNRELPRIAGEVHGAAEALVGRHRRAGAQARRHGDDAGDSAGVRTLSHQGIRRRPLGGAGTGQGLLGQGPARSASDRTISTSSGSNSSATTPSGARPSRPISSTGLPSAAASNGRRPTIFRRCTKSASSRKNSRMRVRGGCRATPSTCAGRCLPMSGSAAPSILPMIEETSDRLLSNGEYHRDSSYFDGIPEFMATGLPEGAELEILETVRDKVPAEVFTTPYKNPVGGNPEAVAQQSARGRRGCSRRPASKSATASWSIPRASRSASNSCAPTRATSAASLFYKPSLERLGITVNIRTVDSVQYQNRMRSFDFDITTVGLGTVAVAGQRAARLLRLAGGGPARFAQHSRHQESRGRCPDRAHHLRQGPRRTGRGLQGDGPRAAVEFLRRPAIRRRIPALRALGPLQPSRAVAQIRRFRIPDAVVV